MLPPDRRLLGAPRSVEQDDGIAPADQLNAVTTLDVLARLIVEHNRRLLAGKPVDWATMTDLLGTAEEACRRLRSSEPAGHDALTSAADAMPRAAVWRQPKEPPPDTSPIYS